MWIPNYTLYIHIHTSWTNESLEPGIPTYSKVKKGWIFQKGVSVNSRVDTQDVSGKVVECFGITFYWILFKITAISYITKALKFDDSMKLFFICVLASGVFAVAFFLCCANYFVEFAHKYSCSWGLKCSLHKILVLGTNCTFVKLVK